MLVHAISLEYMNNDLKCVTKLNPIEIDIVRISARAAAASLAGQSGREATNSEAVCQSYLHTLVEVENTLGALDDRHYPPPRFEIRDEQKIGQVAEYNGFGRFRTDFDIEYLAGEATRTPIMRPIELTLVKDKVLDFVSAAAAMRHALNLCVLMANQKDTVKNSYTLRLCLISHLFTRVIPLPLAVGHPDRNRTCFWHAQDMRYETQQDFLALLAMLSRHFATTALSVKITRSGDAIRMLTFACMATVADAVMRKIACDIPSQVSLHYSGRAKGPVKPFAFDMGNFAEESEFLKFSTPEGTAARAQVLDYFYQLKRHTREDHLMFRFDVSNECSYGDKLFIDQLCVQLGFARGREKEYITGVDRNMLDHYPELGHFRDLVFLFKLVMVPTTDQLPELKPWNAEDVALNWSVKEASKTPPQGMYVVRAFDRELTCEQVQVSSGLGLGPRLS